MCVCGPPVLGEGAEVGDLQRVGVRLVVLLVDKRPRAVLAVLFHHLMKQHGSPCEISEQHEVMDGGEHTLTWPSTIHRDMAVLPSGPGWNRSVAVLGLMLEMTRLDGAPGSSADSK